MTPIVTPQEMTAIDAEAPVSTDVLIARAGYATARAAKAMLGGVYGQRIVVLVGPGNNGRDGEYAAEVLSGQGASITIHHLGELPKEIRHADLVIDAVLGTGARPGFVAPVVSRQIPVLAVDLPSGVDGLSGEANPGVLKADRTITFQAYKSGLLQGDGRELAGEVEVADIGLDASRAQAWKITDADVAAWLTTRPSDSHKWQSAVWIVAGSPTMMGASHLAARAAQRCGAGYVRVSAPGVEADPARPTEAVGWPLSPVGWGGRVAKELTRFKSVLVGPGLGRGPELRREIARLLTASVLPVVVDGDGLGALEDETFEIMRDRGAATILTPHDGEYTHLMGEAPGHDRLAAARRLAKESGAIVLLKGPNTVVARPSGGAFVVSSGDARLATAGTGDVLAGMLVALIARGLEPASAAAAAAHLHGRAGALGYRDGLIASDLIDCLPVVLLQI